MPLNKKNALIFAKGFCMGCADIVPGVSGGTVALVTGIYDQLIQAISSVNKEFIKLALSFKIKDALTHINFPFLLPLMIGIFAAVISMAKVIHYFMAEYSTYTWALFFGLILSSIYYVAKMIPNIKQPKLIACALFGTIVGYLVVSAFPVDTPNSHLFIFLSGCVAICAMILPGISGSFILLILGKYLYVTSALKNPFVDNNLAIIFVFALGCLVGLLAFSKLLNYLLKHWHDFIMAMLMGFMIGSLRKIWPWREAIESKIIRGKTHVLTDTIYFPTDFNFEVIMAFTIMLLGIASVILIELISHRKNH